LRKWTVDAIVTLVDPNDFGSYGTKWPAEVLLEVAVVFMRRQAEEVPDAQGLTRRTEFYIERDV
jgi:hypothetical protein